MKKNVLSIIMILIGAVIGGIAGIISTSQEYGKRISKINNLSDKHLALFLLMNQWVKIKQEKKSIAQYLEDREYNEIAIYGMSYVGETLMDELKNTGIHVKYGIDKNANGMYLDTKVVTLEKPLEQVDAVVVTAICSFDEISSELREKVDCPILCLEDIVYEIL